MNNTAARRTRWMIVLPFACLLLTAGLLWWGTVWKLLLPEGETLLVWHWRIMPVLRWPLALLTMGLVAWIWAAIRRAHTPGCWTWLLAPLVFTPLPALLALFTDLLPRLLVSNGLFFGWIITAAWSGTRIYSAYRAPALLAGPSARALLAWGLFIIGACAYGFGGYHFSSHAGEHLGDEGHYLIQARSLYEHGNLDLRRYITDEHGRRLASKSHFHIAATSRSPHYYSWHTFGLSLIAAPLWPWDIAARHFLLGLIAGAGLAGLFLLAMESGAGIRASLTISLALGASTYWTLYAFRFLPETMGATLLMWSFFAVALQRRRPWTAVFLAAIMNGYLPLAHTRFLPLSLMAFGFFGLMGLFGGTPERWPQRLIRLTAFSLLSFAIYGMYALIQFKMFVGGSAYPINSTLFSYLPGAWEVFADARGAAPILPLLYWMIPAALVWPWKDRSQPIFSLGLLLTFAACVLTSCTNRVSVGGSCVQGRYLLVVVPLLAPGAAWCLRRATSKETFLFMLLGAVSILPLFFLLFWLPHIARNFTEPFFTIGAQPLFDGIFMPYIGLRSIHLPTLVFRAAAIAPLVFLTAILFLQCGLRRFGWILTGLAFAAALFVHANTVMPGRERSPNETTSLLDRVDVQQIRLARRPDDRDLNFFEIFGREFRDFMHHGKLVLTTEELAATEPPIYREKDIERNDWDGRPYRWFTLTGPFSPSRGTWILHVSGTISGKARPHLVIKEGAHVRVETGIPVENGKWMLNQLVELQGKKGDLYLLLRVEGKGKWTCQIEQMLFSRYDPAILKDARLTLDTDFTRTSFPDSDPVPVSSTNDHTASWAMPDED